MGSLPAECRQAQRRIVRADGGVEQVRIAPGAAENVLARALAGDEIGTRMVLREEQAA